MTTWTAARVRALLDTDFADERVLVLANREPCRHDATRDGRIVTTRTASGLVTAVEPVVAACHGVWIAHGSGSGDRLMVDATDHVTVNSPGGDYQLRRLWLSATEERGYYAGFANEALWPLCHDVGVEAVFRRSDFHHYERVNARFAAAAVEEAGSHSPLVLVHDYHLALAPLQIRRRLPHSAIVSFWHIPWPAVETLATCPWAPALVRGLLGSSIVGFQTPADGEHFLDAAERLVRARVDRRAGVVTCEGRRTLVKAYPIAIESPSPWVRQVPSVDECRTRIRRELQVDDETLLMVGVDRLDYTKGIAEKCAALEQLLASQPDYRGRVTLVQIAEPSRESLPAYQQNRQRVLAAVARINARFGHEGYRPVILREAHHEPTEVFAYLRAADVCYVGSLKDGMNLVAKEFVAARSDGRGVLVLARGAGAAHQLDGAVLIEPTEVAGTAARLGYALAMSIGEQVRRMSAMRAVIDEQNLYWWAGQMLEDTAEWRGTRVTTPAAAANAATSSAQRLSA